MTADNAPGRKAARRLVRSLGYISEEAGVTPPSKADIIEKDPKLSQEFAEGRAIQRDRTQRARSNKAK
ncbi:hypothetical protein IID22_04405 [Patescibacteria group bacterium]|nr:hypothetical protein [Patescibacteria group bacterium]